MFLKFRLFLSLFLFFMIVVPSFPNGNLQQQEDEITQTQSTLNTSIVEDDFNPGLLIFALIVMGLALICVGVGIVITFFLLILFVFISTGILSLSVLIGLYKKSLKSGTQTFLFVTTIIGGLFLGSLSLFFINRNTHWFTQQNSLLLGGLAGAISGVLFGYFIIFVIKQAIRFFKTKLKATS